MSSPDPLTHCLAHNLNFSLIGNANSGNASQSQLSPSSNARASGAQQVNNSGMNYHLRLNHQKSSAIQNISRNVGENGFHSDSSALLTLIKSKNNKTLIGWAKSLFIYARTENLLG